jgi:hypothetical protein
MSKIQNSPKQPKTTQHYSSCACCNSPKPGSLDTNTESVRQKPKLFDQIIASQGNSINFLNMKNAGKKLKTQHEIESNKNTRHTFCGLASNKEFVNILEQNSPTQENPSKKSYHFNGLTSCKSIWRCPSCNLKLLKGRATEVYQLTSAHQKQNYEIGFVTLTIKHNIKDSLKTSLNKLGDQYRKFQRHTHFSTLKKDLLLGQIKSTEITYSTRNGWHPHLHIIYFYKSSDINQIQKEQQKLIQNWANYTDGKLISQNQQIGYSSTKLAKYITKWDIVQELTNDFSKKAKGLKPFELLSIIAKNQHQFPNKNLEASLQQTKSLWLEYVEATKGKRRITTSPKLNLLYKVQIKSDDQIIDQKQEGENIISFSRQTWSIIYENNLQPFLIDICKTHSFIITQQKEIIKFLSEFAHITKDTRTLNFNPASNCTLYLQSEIN